MPSYNVDVPFWRHGELLPFNSEVTMTLPEAKYLGHVITENKALTTKTSESAPAAAPEPETEPAPPPLAAAVVEQPAHGNGRRHRRNAE